MLHKFLNDLKLSILKNKENQRKPLKCLELKVGKQQGIQKENFDSCTRKLLKVNCKTIPGKSSLIWLSELVYNILVKIVISMDIYYILPFQRNASIFVFFLVALRSFSTFPFFFTFNKLTLKIGIEKRTYRNDKRVKKNQTL